jgi:hypothetical protein
LQHSIAVNISFWEQLQRKKALFHAVIHRRGEKNRLFTCIFRDFRLRYGGSLAIVPSGPGFFPSQFQDKRLTPAPDHSGRNEKSGG